MGLPSPNSSGAFVDDEGIPVNALAKLTLLSIEQYGWEKQSDDRRPVRNWIGKRPALPWVRLGSCLVVVPHPCAARSDDDDDTDDDDGIYKSWGMARQNGMREETEILILVGIVFCDKFAPRPPRSFCYPREGQNDFPPCMRTCFARARARSQRQRQSQSKYSVVSTWSPIGPSLGCLVIGSRRGSTILSLIEVFILPGRSVGLARTKEVRSTP